MAELEVTAQDITNMKEAERILRGLVGALGVVQAALRLAPAVEVSRKLAEQNAGNAAALEAKRTQAKMDLEVELAAARTAAEAEIQEALADLREQTRAAEQRLGDIRAELTSALASLESRKDSLRREINDLNALKAVKNQELADLIAVAQEELATVKAATVEAKVAHEVELGQQREAVAAIVAERERIKNELKSILG